MGRPTDYSDELATELCERIASGRSLRSICGDDDMPGETTVRRWLADKEREAFRRQYAHAREAQADVLADEIVDIADTDEDTNKARLRVDARKWKAARLAPKKYGDKVALTGGDEGDPPIRIARDLSGLTDEELAFAKRVAAKLADPAGD